MKRFVAAALGVVVAGGLGLGIYMATRSSADSSSASSPSAPSSGAPMSAAHDSASASRARPSKPAPNTGGTESAAPRSGSTTSASADAAAGSTASSTTPVGLPAPIQTAAEPHSTRAFKQRTAPPANQTQQERMNLRFEAAACKAPGTAERYRKLDIEARANLRARCLKAGVILDEPPT